MGEKTRKQMYGTVLLSLLRLLFKLLWESDVLHGSSCFRVAEFASRNSAGFR